jgi:fido (protein-threonine AMPylation protein)
VIFFRQLSLNAGFLLDFRKIDKEQLLIADINALNGNYGDLINILGKAIKKHRSL